MIGLWSSGNLQVGVAVGRSVKWATGYQTALASLVNSGATIVDGTVGDTTTWIPSSTGGSVTACWDLGAASPVTRVRIKIGYQNNTGLDFECSNDGTTWANAFTSAPTLPVGFGTFAWYDFDKSNITATHYRYWRVSYSDSGGDARIGDFRLYNGATIYDVSGATIQTLEGTGAISVPTTGNANALYSAIGAASILNTVTAAETLIQFVNSTSALGLSTTANETLIQFVNSTSALGLSTSAIDTLIQSVTGTGSVGLAVDATDIRKLFADASPLVSILSTGAIPSAIYLEAAIALQTMAEANATGTYCANADALISTVVDALAVKMYWLRADVGLGISTDAFGGAILECVATDALVSMTVQATATKKTFVDNNSLSRRPSALIAFGANGNLVKRHGVQANASLSIATDAVQHFKCSLAGNPGIAVSSTSSALKRLNVAAVGSVNITLSAEQRKQAGLSSSVSLAVVTVADARRIAMVDANAIVGVVADSVTAIRVHRLAAAPSVAIVATGASGASLKAAADVSVSIAATGADWVKRWFQSNPSVNTAATANIVRTANLMGFADITLNVDDADAIAKRMFDASPSIGIATTASDVRRQYAGASPAISISATDTNQSANAKSLEGSAQITLSANSSAILKVFAKSSASISVLADAFIETGYEVTIVDDFTIYLRWVEDQVVELDAISDALAPLVAISDL